MVEKSALHAAAKVFDFQIPDRLDDSVVVGKICGVNICTGELRRLSKALRECPENLSPHDANILFLLKRHSLIEAIRFRRTETNEGLKEAKDYVEEIGERYGLRRRDGFDTWSWA